MHGETRKKKCTDCGAFLVPDSKFCHSCGSKVVITDWEELTGEDVFNFDDDLQYNSPNLNDDGDTITIRLFKIVSIVDNFKYKEKEYDNVKINWYVVDREAPIIPYEKVIMLYSRMSGSEKENITQYVDEKFTLREGRLLEKYIESTQNIKTVFEEIRIPIVENVRSFSKMVGIRNTSRISLYKKRGYNLPFNVEGIFNITDAEESIPWDSKDTVISKNIKQELEAYAKNRNGRS